MNAGQVIQGSFPAGLVRIISMPLQRHASPNGVTVLLPQQMSAFPAPGVGMPLPPHVRAPLEAAFRTSFSDVRVHVGPHAGTLGAQAFTRGSNIHFAPGQYNPTSPQGRQMLAHELAHVVQQRNGRVRNPFGSGVAVVHDRMLEAEAERMAREAAAPAPIQCAAAIKRPGFTTSAKRGALAEHNLFAGTFTVDEKKPGLPSINAAMPHRMSWKDIRDNTAKFAAGEEDDDDFRRWTSRFILAGKMKLATLRKAREQARRVNDKERAQKITDLMEKRQEALDAFVAARDAYADRKTKPHLAAWVKLANSFFANVPDLGPHKGVNIQVGERAHLNFGPLKGRGRTRHRSPSPMSRAVIDSSPERTSGVAVTDEKKLITPGGATVPLREISAVDRKKLERHGLHEIRSFKDDAQFGPKKGGRDGGGGGGGGGGPIRRGRTKHRGRK